MYIVKSDGIIERKFLTFKNVQYYLQEMFGNVHYLLHYTYGEWYPVYNDDYKEVAKICIVDGDE